MSVLRRLALGCLGGLGLLLAGCGGGDGGSASPTPVPTTPAATSPYAVPATEALSVGDVQQVLAQAIAQAQADGAPAVISVVDRVGNVLALFRMAGAPATVHVTDAPNGQNLDVQGLDLPAEASALAKAITGAYLSSSGNAFSTRTASMITSAQFPPEAGTTGLGSGPLYGVQFSQLPCSDLAQRFGATGVGAMIGPKRSPLGLAADPGGFPLYKNGVVVGGIGVEADGKYGFDANVQQTNLVTDERIAIAGTVGFAAPATITADTIYAAGTQLIYTDVTAAGIGASGSARYASVSSAGTLEALKGYTAGAILAGSAYGSEASGVRAASLAGLANAGAFVLSDGAGNERFPIRAGTDTGDVASPLSANEVSTILQQALAVASAARAAIRNPTGSLVQVSISVVDTHGAVLGLIRTPDAPVFGIDVSLQKARSAAFFSHPAAASDLTADPDPRVAGYVGAAQSFLGLPAALNGGHAISARALGNLARPTFPDGTVGNPAGPFSTTAAQFNPFATGLQSALITPNLGAHVAYVTGAAASDTPQRCTHLPDVATGQNRLQNGIQIFPGGMPIYRGSTLIGGIGISGDGVDQDDMTAFLGLAKAASALGTLGNAPTAIRADQITVHLPNGTVANLKYVNCPQAPFVTGSSQTPCAGL